MSATNTCYLEACILRFAGDTSLWFFVIVDSITLVHFELAVRACNF
jgi:hypothetical protein